MIRILKGGCTTDDYKLLLELFTIAFDYAVQKGHSISERPIASIASVIGWLRKQL